MLEMLEESLKAQDPTLTDELAAFAAAAPGTPPRAMALIWSWVIWNHSPSPSGWPTAARNFSYACSAFAAMPAPYPTHQPPRSGVAQDHPVSLSYAVSWGFADPRVLA